MKKFTTWMIIIGILVALSPIAGKFYVSWRENRLLDDWYNSEDAAAVEILSESNTDPEEGYEQLKNAFAADVGDNQGNVETTSTDNLSTSSSDSTSSGNSADSASRNSSTKVNSTAQQAVLGIIKIDKIKVKYPIIEGVKASNLKVGIGHIPGTAGLGQPGNCALAGHRNYTFGRFFNRLDELKDGDIISITTKKEELKYKVYKKLVVKPDEVSVLKGSKEETILTLISCTPVYVATHRLIVHARLEERILLEP